MKLVAVADGYGLSVAASIDRNATDDCERPYSFLSPTNIPAGETPWVEISPRSSLPRML